MYGKIVVFHWIKFQRKYLSKAPKVHRAWPIQCANAYENLFTILNSWPLDMIIDSWNEIHNKMSKPSKWVILCLEWIKLLGRWIKAPCNKKTVRKIISQWIPLYATIYLQQLEGQHQMHAHCTPKTKNTIHAVWVSKIWYSHILTYF